MGFEWFSPILPDLPWAYYFFLGTVPPMAGFLVVQGAFMAKQGSTETEEHAEQGEGGMVMRLMATVATAALTTLLLAVILLNMGFLGFRSMVVISGSMSPTFNVGDIVITRSVPPEELAVGDVIRYRRNQVNIVHRVLEIEKNNGEIVLTTKGDANNTIDRPRPEPIDVIGRSVMRVPKLGWLTIALSQRAGN
jgi:signal peptidase